jgi:Right handed beta helix region
MSSRPSTHHWIAELAGKSARYIGSAAGLAAAVVIACAALPKLVASDQGAVRLTHVVAFAPAMRDCAASPHVCGYPDAANTGVPASMYLLSVPDQVSSGPGWKYDPRGWVEVYGNGAVLSGLYIPYNLDISASNVTIKDVTVMQAGDGFGISLRHTRDATIEDSDIYSPYATGPDRLQVAIKDIYGDSTGTKVESDNIWHTSTGIQLSEGTVADNYVHDLAYTTGDHVNGIVSDEGVAAGLTITHNTVFNPVGQTDCIAMLEAFGQQENVTITGNLISGGGYEIYGGDGRWTPANIVITGNRFARTYYPNGGFYGPAAYVSTPGANGDVWSGNVWDDTGSPVNL